jgi:general secretion pathway protein D
MKTKLEVILIIALLVIFPMGRVFSQEVGVGAGEAAGQIGTAQVEEIPSENIVEILTDIIPQPPGSSIRVIPGQNKLVVRNTPSNLRKIEKFIEDLATPPQVSIEAKFVSVGEDTYKDLGLEWSSLSLGWANSIGRAKRYSGLSPGDIRYNPTTGIYDTAWSYDTITGSLAAGISLGPPSTLEQATGTYGQITYSSLNYPQFTAILHMLSTRADTQFLSAPRVTTLNNEPATIRFVTTIRYVESVDVETETDEDTGVTTTTYDWTWVDRDVGIVLYVSPIVIRPTQSVRLFLQPVVSERSGQTDTFTLSIVDGVPLTVTMPQFISRDLTTNVDVHDGTTVVLGGLLNEETTELLSKVPFLGDIPVIGKAFQRKTASTERQHLLIFITVNVLDTQGNPFFEKG